MKAGTGHRRRSSARIALSIALALAASGCASRGARDCDSIAGPGWQHLSSAPADRVELLTRANLPSEADVLWFAQGEDKVLVCDPSNSLVNPGCGGSTAYQFERTASGAWASKGVLLPICNDGSQ